MAKKVPNLPGLQVPPDVPPVERLRDIPRRPSKLGAVIFVLDFSGSTAKFHGDFRGMVGGMANDVLVNYPQAGPRVQVSVAGISGGPWVNLPPLDFYLPLDGLRAPEVEVGGDSPILQSASVIGDMARAAHVEILRTSRIVTHKVVFATDCGDNIVSASEQARAAAPWQQFLQDSPLTEVTLIVPDQSYNRDVAKLLFRPEQSLDDVIVLKDALSMGPKLFERFAQVLRDVSKTVTGSGSTKLIKAPIQAMVLSTED